MDDLGFVRKFIKGDILAREEFLKRYSRLIYSYIYHTLRLKGFNLYVESADDIFQSFFAFIIAEDCKRLKSFGAKNGCTLATWIRQLVINFTIDYIRKIQRRVSVDNEASDAESLKGILPDNSLPVTDLLNLKENLKVLAYCIELLNTDDKLLLEFNLNQGVRLEDLKDLLGLSRGAIDMRRSRIIEKLRDCFKEKGFLC
ncbi:MAG: sigma-70 family RNA polymerase sigma factor [Candidatus Omnitrophota bacterium]